MWFELVFSLKSLLERLKRDFDDSKIVSFQFTGKLLVCHFSMLFARLDGLSVGNMIPDLLSSAISNEKSLFGP